MFQARKYSWGELLNREGALLLAHAFRVCQALVFANVSAWPQRLYSQHTAPTSSPPSRRHVFAHWHLLSVHDPRQPLCKTRGLLNVWACTDACFDSVISLRTSPVPCAATRR